MRLWHVKLLSILPDKQLLSQHRECCALRGNGWGKKHATVDYVFKYHPRLLFHYHMLVMNEFAKRGWTPDPVWKDICYRGKCCEPYPASSCNEYESYPEHNDEYYQECLENLRLKGAILKGHSDPRGEQGPSGVVTREDNTLKYFVEQVIKRKERK